MFWGATYYHAMYNGDELWKFDYPSLFFWCVSGVALDYLNIVWLFQIIQGHTYIKIIYLTKRSEIKSFIYRFKELHETRLNQLKYPQQTTKCIIAENNGFFLVQH